MGVPAFYRWLSERYSRIVVYAKEDPHCTDLTEPNPNDYEFDNLYLDMNGLIHPCTHPEGEKPPETEEDMYVAVCNYVDRLFNIIRPRKLLFMAIDGVAPRAKMNQQRSRRFRSSQEAEENSKSAKQLRAEMMQEGRIPPEEQETNEWDSNVITPGTQFMQKLSDRVKEYILMRMNTNPAWKDVKVVFSDAQVIGEGEHKLMEYIRTQRCQEGYDPNTTHCIYGLDADLIMLALATHEVHFSILREEVLFGKQNKSNNNGFKVDSVLDKEVDVMQQYDLLKSKKKPFQLLRVYVLREYLEYEFRPDAFYSKLPFQYDFERCIDDFVFLCFFVGNDFLPHLPSLSIREGALELIIDLYKRFLPTLKGYVTDNGVIDLSRAEVILRALGSVEDEIFRRRRTFEMNSQRRRLEQMRYQNRQSLENQNNKRKRDEDAKKVDESEFKEALKKKQQDRDKFEVLDANTQKQQKELYKLADEKVIIDEVNLGERGWKDRYYITKFEIKPCDVKPHSRTVVKEYLKGLCWVLLYYFQGAKQWDWYYPYHYAPFASDMVNLAPLGPFNFPKSLPFRPFEQLLSVLPSSSAHALPKCLRWFMTDEDSPIYEFYPKEFKYDPNGKGVRWLWIALLPFVDENKIIETVRKMEDQFTDEEKKRNSTGDVLLFLHSKSDHGKKLFYLINEKERSELKVRTKEVGLRGYINTKLVYKLGERVSVAKESKLSPIERNDVIAAKFKLPKSKGNFIIGLLNGVKIPEKMLTDAERMQPGTSNPRGHFVGGLYGQMFDKFNNTPQSQNNMNSWGSMEPRNNPKRHINGYNDSSRNHHDGYDRHSNPQPVHSSYNPPSVQPYYPQHRPVAPVPQQYYYARPFVPPSMPPRYHGHYDPRVPRMPMPPRNPIMYGSGNQPSRGVNHVKTSVLDQIGAQLNKKRRQ